MALRKKDAEEIKVKIDEVLKKVGNTIVYDKCPVEQLPELINAYTELIYARMEL